MSIDSRHNFCHSKRAFVRYSLVVVSEKKCVDKLWLKLFVNEINTIHMQHYLQVLQSYTV